MLREVGDPFDLVAAHLARHRLRRCTDWLRGVARLLRTVVDNLGLRRVAINVLQCKCFNTVIFSTIGNCTFTYITLSARNI